MKILIWIGSLRSASFSRKVAEAAVAAAPPHTRFDLIDGRDLPLFDQDLEEGEKPVPVQILIDQISAADAQIFVTPEFNCGIPGTLKNAIDWASRPPFRSPLRNKPSTIVSHSPAPTGGARAYTQLTSVLAGTLTPLLLAPAMTISTVHEKFDATGALTDEQTASRLVRMLNDLIAWAPTLRP